MLSIMESNGGFQSLCKHKQSKSHQTVDALDVRMSWQRKAPGPGFIKTVKEEPTCCRLLLVFTSKDKRPGVFLSPEEPLWVASGWGGRVSGCYTSLSSYQPMNFYASIYLSIYIHISNYLSIYLPTYTYLPMYLLACWVLGTTTLLSKSF